MTGSKPTGSGLLARARAHLGEPYVNVNVPKNDPNWKGPWDCAEFASWLVYQEAGILYGCNSASADPATAQAYTGYWERDAKAQGKRIPIDEAAGIEGAFLLRYPPAPDVMGHIVVSDGKGGTVEAMGKKWGVAAGKVSGRRWDTGVLVPGIAYGTAGDVAVAPPPAVYALGISNMDPKVIAGIQRALRLKGYDPGTAEGSFDQKTAQAVAAFQRANELVEDGEVGPLTSKALGAVLNASELAQSAVAMVNPASILDPLVGIAASVLPEVLKLVVGDKAVEIAQKIGRTVFDVAGSNDPAIARQKIDGDPAIKAQLQARLAEIAVKQEEVREQARLEAIRVQSETDRAERARQLDMLKLQIDDVQDARAAATARAAQGGLMGAGPLVVSLIVLAGFLAMLIGFCLLLYFGKDINSSSGLYQLINVAFGTLAAAFATVVSFWLGSSQGSRAKDAASIGMQAEQSRQLGQNAVAAAVAATAAQAAPAAIVAVAKSMDTGTPANSNFPRCLDVVFAKEGGFSNDANDNGGPTLYGITLQTFRSWRGDNKLTDADLRTMKQDEAAEIYRVNYWNAMRCDELPRGVDLIVFDFGVNAGPARSARMLQKIIGADPDGSIGPATLAAAKTMTPRDIIAEMSKKKLEYYKSLDDWPSFGNGWTNRTNSVEKSSLAMLDGGG